MIQPKNHDSTKYQDSISDGDDASRNINHVVDVVIKMNQIAEEGLVGITFVRIILRPISHLQKNVNFFKLQTKAAAPCFGMSPMYIKTAVISPRLMMRMKPGIRTLRTSFISLKSNLLLLNCVRVQIVAEGDVAK